MAALLQKTAGPSPFDVSRLGRNGAPYPEALLNEGDVGALARNLNATQIYLDTHVSHNTEPGLYLATAYTSKDNGKSYQGGTRDPVRPQGSMNSSHVPKSRKKKSTYIVEQTFKVRGANGNTKKYERPLYIRPRPRSTLIATELIFDFLNTWRSNKLDPKGVTEY